MVSLEENTQPTNGNTMPVEMEAPPFKGELVTMNPEAVNNVLYSEVGINVLLNRLKQSITSAKEFSSFLGKRARIEEEHAKSLEKLNKTTNDAVHRSDGRQGSYSLQMVEVCRAHDRMCAHGNQFANSLNQMHLDLDKLATSMDMGRKHWKTEGTANEKKVKDAESALEKAKSKYDSLADDYDKARTGGGNSGRVFTVKGPKSAEKHEEDLHRKLQAADSDYSNKVQIAQQTRQENLRASRPQAVKAIQELIRECDSALTLQLQKFAAFNEKLLVGNGMEVSPMRGAEGEASTIPSMREMIQRIDNERDFQSYVTSHAGTVPRTPAEIKYEKHPVLGPTQQAPVTPINASNANKRLSFQQSPQSPQASTFSVTQPPTSQPAPQIAPPSFTSVQAQPPSSSPSPYSTIQREQATAPQLPPLQSSTPTPVPYTTSSPAPSSGYGQAAQPSGSYRGPPTQQQQQPYKAVSVENGAYAAAGSYRGGPNQPPMQQQGYSPGGASPNGARPPPLKPVFGQSLEALFRRDDTAVPIIVYQCIQAVDLFGLDVEGIYRLSGNANHINKLKAVFDNDSSRVDFRNPEAFHHDINSVASLLKQFFRDLPDPLFPAEHYAEFIEAARIDDDNVRRDSIHAVINGLPDPNYATLRAVALHLYRVQDHAQANRMSTHNLAICFAPTLMGQHTGPQMADAGLQARVIDTILRNTFQIFDED